MALKLGELSVILKGDSTDLNKNMSKAEKALEGVGDTAKREAAAVAMAMHDMGMSARTAGTGFDRAGEAADNLDTKAMGFRDTLTGVQDGAEGAKKAMSGDWGIETFLLLGFGVGDLASGFYNLLIPAMKSAVTWLKATKVGALASAAASGVARAATATWTAMQWLLNTALLANPIGLIIVGVMALVGVFVLLWVKFAGFREFWIKTWEVVKTAAIAVWDFLVGAAKLWWKTFSGFWTGVGRFFARLWGGIADGVRAAWGWITDRFDKVVSFVGGLPKRLRAKARGMFDGIKEAFRSAINWMIGKWNDFHLTLGGGSVLGIGIPSVTLSTPNLPMLAKGGTALAPGWSIVGERGPELAYLNRGATVEPLRGGTGGGGPDFTIRLVHQWPDGRVIKDQLIDSASLRGQTVGKYLGLTQGDWSR